MFWKTLEKFRSAKREVQTKLQLLLIATLGYGPAVSLMSMFTPRKRVGEPDVFNTIIELAVAVIIVGVIFPIALPYVITASFGTTSLATTLAILFQVLVSIVSVVVVIMLFLKFRNA